MRGINYELSNPGGGGTFLGIRSGGVLCGSPNPDAKNLFQINTCRANVKEYSPGDFRCLDD